jgi:hypothetical protein
MPIRVFAILESNKPTDAIRAARKRISLMKFAEFMAAFPDFANNPEKDFVIINDLKPPGERL